MASFDDFNEQSLAEASAIYGTSSFNVAGAPYTGGILNEFTAARQLDLGGFVGDYDATLLAPLPQFSSVATPIERTLEGTNLVIGGRTFRVDRVALDSLTATFGLSNPNKIRR